MNKVLGLAREKLEKFSQFPFTGWGFQIFDNVELDVAVAKNFQRAV